MKYIKPFNYLNISKKKFLSNKYDIYKLPKSDLGKWLNVWFPGDQFDAAYKKTRKGHSGQYFVDEMWTVKKVDKETSHHLYMKIYNPVSIIITHPPLSKKVEMICRIHSIDDSSFGIWFSNPEYNLEDLKDKRTDLMKWISSLEVINGEQFLKKCIEFGADESTIDYN